MNRFTILTFSLLALPARGFCEVAFSNFGPGMSYGIGGWSISGPSTLSGSSIAGARFSSATSGSLSSIDIALGYIGGTTNGAEVRLHSSSASGEIGGVLESWTAQNLAPFDIFTGTGGGVVSLTSTTSTLLSQGTDYWITVWPEGLDSEIAWMWPDNQNEFLPFAYSTNGGSNFQYPGDSIPGTFQVNTVPEPTTLIALGLGAGLLHQKRRMNR